MAGPQSAPVAGPKSAAAGPASGAPAAHDDAAIPAVSARPRGWVSSQAITASSVAAAVAAASLAFTVAGRLVGWSVPPRVRLLWRADCPSGCGGAGHGG